MYRAGEIIFPKGEVSGNVPLVPGETYTYYGKLRVESVSPNLVISFVTYKAVTPTQGQTPAVTASTTLLATATPTPSPTPTVAEPTATPTPASQTNEQLAKTYS
jgi:hypothetical protein